MRDPLTPRKAVQFRVGGPSGRLHSSWAQGRASEQLVQSRVFVAMLLARNRSVSLQSGNGGACKCHNGSREFDLCTHVHTRQTNSLLIFNGSSNHSPLSVMSIERSDQLLVYGTEGGVRRVRSVPRQWLDPPGVQSSNWPAHAALESCRYSGARLMCRRKRPVRRRFVDIKHLRLPYLPFLIHTHNRFLISQHSTPVSHSFQQTF